MQRTPRATCYARLEFQMILLIASFRCGAGPDALDGTADDPQMDQPTAFSLLGLGAAGTAPASPRLADGTTPQANGIQSLIVFKSPNPVFRIVSVGKSGDVTRSVEMVVQKQVMPVGVAAGVGAAIAAGRPQVFSWKEL